MPNTRSLLFDTIEEIVDTYTSHPYLRACQIPQPVSKFHFDVAYAIMSAAHVNEETMGNVLKAVLLLERGLTVHDHVDERTGVLRQLSVLAGDYNSSQYYAVLAQIGNVHLLSMLSRAIARINSAKMKLNQMDEPVDSKICLELLETIHGSLLLSLAEHFLGSDGVWISHVQSLVKAYVVQDEMTAYSAPRFFTFRQAYEWVTDSVERVRLMPANTFVNPIYNFLLEYLLPIQNTLEILNVAEGNH